MSTKYTQSVVPSGIFLIGLVLVIFTGSWRPGITPSPIPSPSILATNESDGILTYPATQALYSEIVEFAVDTKEIDGILTHPAASAPYLAIVLLHGADRSRAQDPYYTAHADYSGLMLNRESQSLDLEEGRLSEQTIDVNAQSVSGQLCVETCT